MYILVLYLYSICTTLVWINELKLLATKFSYPYYKTFMCENVIVSRLWLNSNLRKTLARMWENYHTIITCLSENSPVIITSMRGTKETHVRRSRVMIGRIWENSLKQKNKNLACKTNVYITRMRQKANVLVTCMWEIPYAAEVIGLRLKCYMIVHDEWILPWPSCRTTPWILQSAVQVQQEMSRQLRDSRQRQGTSTVRNLNFCIFYFIIVIYL